MHKICNDPDLVHICTSSSHLKGWHELSSNEGEAQDPRDSWQVTSCVSVRFDKGWHQGARREKQLDRTKISVRAQSKPKGTAEFEIGS